MVHDGSYIYLYPVPFSACNHVPPSFCVIAGAHLDVSR